MTTNFSIRPVGAPAPSTVVQPSSQAAGSAVATELPASQSVTAAEASGAARNDPQLASNEFVTRQAFFDRSAGSMVYQEVNSSTDQVVEQYPDEAVLRRRAYFHALDLAKSEPQRAMPTDLVA